MRATCRVLVPVVKFDECDEAVAVLVIQFIRSTMSESRLTLVNHSLTLFKIDRPQRSCGGLFLGWEAWPKGLSRRSSFVSPFCPSTNNISRRFGSPARRRDVLVLRSAYDLPVTQW